MKFYRALLHLYPKSFREEYGEEMCRVFARRETSWLAAILEVIFNAAAVHCDIARQDFGYTVRTLLRSPGFTITAILVAALGVGANTAVFSIADHVFLRPLPFPDSDRLVKVWESHPGYGRMELSAANYRDWRKVARSFDGFGIYDTSSMNLVGQGDPERLNTGDVSADLMPLLGVKPLMGRLFAPEDDREGAPATAILSESLWQAAFGGDREILGRKILLDGQPFLVIGVLPRDFHFPNSKTELWVPFQFGEAVYQDRNNNFLQCIGKLKKGVSLRTAQAELTVVAAQLEKQYPKENRQTGATVYFLHDEYSDRSMLLLEALIGAAFCVLLIACTNLANLLLARAMTRHKELSVRMALGAGRVRLVRQMITESLLLAFAGGLLGVAIATAAVPALARLIPTGLPISDSPSLDLRILAFAALLTAVTGLAFGVIPAWRVSRGSDLTGLREGSRSGGGRKTRLRATLVVAEVTVSVILLVSAGLLMRALWRVQGTDPGFRSAGVMTMRTTLPFNKYGKVAARAAFYDRVLSDVRQIPGVTSAAYISFLPMVMGGGIWPVGIGGETLDRSENHVASMRFVTPGFFTTLSIPLHRGRDVEDGDTATRPYIAIVSESFVERYWPGQDPIGRHFDFGRHDRIVAGVVADIRVRGLENTSEPQVYLPYRQVNDDQFGFYAPKDIAIRSTLDGAALAPQLRQIVRNADGEQPVVNVRTMEEIVDDQTASRTLQVRVIGVFAAIAFLLAGIGIYGVLSFAVSQRTPEIGVRIALGARSGDILGMIMKQGLLLAGVGVLLGAVLAYASARAMQALLAGVRPDDVVTFGFALALCALMTLAGSLLPALRAIRVDPLTAMRAE